MSSRRVIRHLLAQSGNPELRAAFIELCERGLVTCTRGNPGDEGATYALAWLPLDNPERFSKEVRERHAQNMARLGVEP